jgi:predicted enzyme related to lactoylglutathione lyase
MKVKEIGLSWIVVNDFEEAVKFYTDVVGLKLLESHPEFGWAELEGADGGARLGIARVSPHEPHQPGQNAVVTFGVENIEKAKAEMVKKGAICQGEIIVIPDHVKMQTIVDKDGNRFQLCEVLHHSCPHC